MPDEHHRGQTAQDDEAADSSPLDFRALEQVRALQSNGQPDVLRRLISMYLSDSPKLLTDICRAVAGGDSAALQRAAHSLKSSSATVGALSLAKHCQALEALGRNRNGDRAAALMAQVHVAHQTACVALAAYLEQRTDAGPGEAR